MDLIDSHAHLDFAQFDVDRAEVLDRARQAGVRTLLAIGSGPGPEKLDAALPYAEQNDWIYATVGIHPHEARLATDADFEQLDRLAKHPRVIAWGEVGLDYHYDHSPRDVQKRVFRCQLEQARAAKLPSSSIAARPGPTAWEFWSRNGAARRWGVYFIVSAARLKWRRRESRWDFWSPSLVTSPIRRRRCCARWRARCPWNAC